MLKSVSLGIAILPGRVTIGITAVSAVSAVSIVSAVVSKTGVQFRVDDWLSDRYRHVFDDGDGVRLGHLNGVWGGNWDLHWNADGNRHRAIYWDRNMLGDFNWVGFGHLDGVWAVNGHGVWHLERKNQISLIDR